MCGGEVHFMTANLPDKGGSYEIDPISLWEIHGGSFVPHVHSTTCLGRNHPL